MSGVCRPVPGSLFWKCGLLRKTLSPPPPPCAKLVRCVGSSATPVVAASKVAWMPHAVSLAPDSVGIPMLVPPTAVTYGESAGMIGAPTAVPTPLSPESPVAALTATPRAAAFFMTPLNNCASSIVLAFSGSPQLFEIVLPRWWAAAY